MIEQIVLTRVRPAEGVMVDSIIVWLVALFAVFPWLSTLLQGWLTPVAP